MLNPLKRELENARGSEHESIFAFKMAFQNAFKLFFFTTSRTERYSAYKVKVLHSQY